MARTDCLACGRPEDLCVCASIRKVANRTPVTILQHPRERGHAFNTVRIARLALEQVSVHVAHRIQMDPLPLPEGTAVLFPGPDAEMLGEGPLPPHLVAIDGTWPQAKSLFRANPWLHGLRMVQLAPDAPSAYTIRKEPAEHCLSSIESITAALKICEPDNPEIEHALTGFHALIAGQVAQRGQRPARPRRLRKRAKVRLRQKLRESWPDVVVVYAETTGLGSEDGGREVLQLTAFRPHDGTRFDSLAQVQEVLDPCLLEHMELTQDMVQGAGGFEELTLAWRAFVRPDDVFLAWSDRGVRRAFACMQHAQPVGPLKSMYCNLRRGPSGRPDQVLEREGLLSEPVSVRGRAGRRLGNAAALATWLRDRPPER